MSFVCINYIGVFIDWIAAANPNKKNKKKGSVAEKDDFEFNDDGKLVIEDSDEEPSHKEKGRKKEKDATFDDMILEQEQEYDAKQGRSAKKRKYKQEDDEDEEEEDTKKNSKQARGKRGQQDKHSGKEYQSRKAVRVLK
jgi:hypothetical protein